MYPNCATKWEIETKKTMPCEKCETIINCNLVLNLRVPGKKGPWHSCPSKECEHIQSSHGVKSQIRVIILQPSLSDPTIPNDAIYSPFANPPEDLVDQKD